MKNLMIKAVSEYARRRLPGARDIYSLSKIYRSAYENYNANIKQNGEAWLIKALPKLNTIFDVGANVGDWSSLARAAHPNAQIHAFELLSELRGNLPGRDLNLILHECGLSDEDAVVPVNYYPGRSVISTIVLDKEIHSDEVSVIEERVRRGDDVCREAGVKRIDLLKIDAEGADHKVLLGMPNMIGSGSVPVIQFEYGMASIATKFLLRDFYQLLGVQYAIGKLFPHWVEFKDYVTEDEDFRGPNYVAVQRTHPDLVRRLSPR